MDFYREHGIRKYGFHGTSHAYVADKAAELLGRPSEESCLITCHLGNGCSMAAVEKGRCIDTTMGLTPLQGLVMGTRCGDIDPAVIFHLLGTDEFHDYHEIDKMLNKKSGLLGLSGISNDVRTLTEHADREGPKSRALLALEVFSYRLCFYIGAYMGILPKVHAIVFTGGIGENSEWVRAHACKNLTNLGVMIDDEANAKTKGGKTTDIAAEASAVRVLVIPTDEEGWIARETYHTCQTSDKSVAAEA